MMKWRNTWLLAGLTVMLFGFIYVYERHTGPPQSAVVPLPRLLARLKAGDVAAVQVQRTNQFRVKAERKGESWELVTPLAYPAAPVAVERLLLALESAVAAARLSPRDLSERGQRLVDFGLDNPDAIVVLEQPGDRIEVQFGARTAAGDQVYVQVVGLPDILVADASLLDLLPRAVNDWRNLALFELANGEIDRLELARPNGGMYLQRDPTNKLWQLNRPRLRADQLKVEDLLEKVQQARVTQFVADDLKVDLEAYGLQSPQVELVLWRGTNLTQKAQFGGSPPNNNSNIYARRLSQTNIVLVPKALLDTLLTPAAEYRDRRLLAFNPASVTQIEVRSEEPFVLRRLTNNAWVSGETTPADPLFVDYWLNRLSQLRVAEFVKDVVTDFAGYGLAPPVRHYLLKTTITNASGITNVGLGEIQFGTNIQDKIYVRRADEDSVYTVGFLDYFHMPGASWQTRDHRIWSFTTNQVNRVTVRQNGLTRVLLRGLNGDWTIAPGSQGVINPLAVEEMMYRLGELNALMWVARGPESLLRYGFSETNLQVTVDIKAGETNRILLVDFGGVSPNGFPYGATAVEGQMWVFEFPWFLFQDFERAFGLPLRRVSAPGAKRETDAGS